MSKPPDRASVIQGERFYNKDCGRIGISIDGVVQEANVLEYCVTGGWARVYRRDADGNKLPGVLGGAGVKKVHGRIEVWWK